MQAYFQEIQWFLYLSNITELSIAFVLALPIGWDREKETRSMGLRTFPLVSLASCGYMLIGESIAQGDPESIARIFYGLMTGIGFIGGGAILKEGGSVKGTATAASIWNTGAVGAAVAFHRYEIAVVLVLANFCALRFMAPLKSKM